MSAVQMLIPESTCSTYYCISVL